MKVQSLFLIALTVTVFFLLSLFIKFSDNDVDWIYESPKLQFVNPFWRKVRSFTENVNFYLFLRDMMLCCNLEYHLEGYLKARTQSDFSNAIVEAEKIIGKKYEVYEWGRGKLIRIKEMGLVLILEK